MHYTTLIDVQALATARDRCCVVDCRHDLADPEAGRRAYAQGHIPGAFFADVETDLSGPKCGTHGRHPLPARDALLATMRRWGLHDDTQLVAYDAHGGSFAARLWWLARWLGHEKVAILDGGWQAWVAAGLPTEQDEPLPGAGTLTARAPLEWPVDVEAVLAAHASPDALLIDARAPDRYAGRQETLDPVAGHIPGAVNRFWQSNLAAGRFKDAASLRAEFDALLAGHDSAQAIHYCGSGVSACHNILAMRIAGLSPGRLYAGSWSQWVADPARPVAQRPTP
ncbi:MAG: sulfurtransferase [Sutterellaceae bacterium]|nr:sulfurtransferase [Burkholderiaceae bacterium]MDW8430228.1 sulfurtransferase [Sutterellaceae bacterium]